MFDSVTKRIFLATLAVAAPVLGGCAGSGSMLPPAALSTAHGVRPMDTHGGVPFAVTCPAAESVRVNRMDTHGGIPLLKAPTDCSFHGATWQVPFPGRYR